MANISKIRLSGTTYSIQDLNATKTVELTQAEYDALSPKDPNTFYIITDATAGDLSNYYTKSETSGATEISTALASKADTATTYTKTETDNAITAATSTKQDTLVSGTNIKTINNQSILGEGNITIQGGGSSYTAGDGIDINNDVISVTGKVDTSTYETYTAATDTALASKQTTLTAGTGISIVDNIISATGGGGGSITIDPSLDTSSTNAVANSAITEAIIIDANNRDSITANDYGGFRTFYATQVKSISFKKVPSDAYIEGYILLDNSSAKYVFSGDTSSSTTLTDAVTLNLESKTASISVKDRNAHTIRELYIQVWHDNTKQRYYYVYDLKTVFNPPLGANKAEFVSNCQHYGINVTNDSMVRLQNTITATAANTTALGGLKLVKLTQSEYDALATKDSQTLYIIVN